MKCWLDVYEIHHKGKSAIQYIPVELNTEESAMSFVNSHAKTPLLDSSSNAVYVLALRKDADDHVLFAQLYGKCVTQPNLGFGEDGLLSLLDEANRLAKHPYAASDLQKRGNK